jgi:DNA invertase Pin-like site-specific DNA recombinase
MRAAIYARVSTDDQDCALQLDALRLYCASRKWEIAREYVDEGWSGSKLARPQLMALKAAAGARQFDVVAVWKLDRWGRSTVDAIQGIQELVAAGVRWIAVTQNLDTDQSNPMARFMLHVMAAFAELEREMIRERVKAGMAVAKRRGTHCGRPKAVIDRRRVGEMQRRGSSVREIARLCGVGKSTVHAVLAAVRSSTR